MLVLSAAYITALSMVALNRAAGTEAAAHEHATGFCQPTSAQLRTAKELVTDTRQGLARFADLPDGLAAGYAPHHHQREAIKHYFNPAYVKDGRVLDPAQPEGLMYAYTDRGPVLVAAVYMMNRPGEAGIAVGGCLTHWHSHTNLCSTDPANGISPACAGGAVLVRAGRCRGRHRRCRTPGSSASQAGPSPIGSTLATSSVSSTPPRARHPGERPVSDACLALPHLPTTRRRAGPRVDKPPGRSSTLVQPCRRGCW